MRAYKERQFLMFELEDGRIVKYNLATGESFGFSGRPVKSIGPQLRGHTIQSVIQSFEDENYRKFLDFLNRNFINVTIRDYRPKRGRATTRITSIGTFLNRVNSYAVFEQIFACGIREVDVNSKTPISEVPKGCLKLMREKNIKYTDDFISKYKENPDLYTFMFNYDFMTLTKDDILWLVNDCNYWRYARNHLQTLTNTYGYDIRRLLIYIDRIMTYEALERSVINELVDYNRMMSAVTQSYDKFPRNFLTTHRISVRNYNRLSQHIEEERFNAIVKPEMEFDWKEFCIIYPKKSQDIKDEAGQQHHCVASYINRVMENETDIVFLRLKEEKDKSLVTLQVTNNKVVQAKGRYNRDCTAEEKLVIAKYNEFLQRKFEKAIDKAE